MAAADIERAQLGLSERFLRLYPGEAARRLESLPAAEVAELLEAMPDSGSVVLERLSQQAAVGVLEALSEETAQRSLSVIEPGCAASLLANLDDEQRERLLDSFPAGQARELRALMSYPPDSAGALMARRMATVPPDATAAEALERLRLLEGRVVANVYLVDLEGGLVGSVALQDLALAPPQTRLSELVRREPIAVQATATQQDVVELQGSHRLSSVPVVDFEGRLLGVIRHDALLTAAEEMASLDLQTMVGASKEERALSPIGFAVKKRLPWLQVNLGTTFLAAAIVGIFENTIARFTMLAVLLPVVAGQSGNTGAQSLAVTMRGLVLREVRPRHWRKLALKEVAVAFVNGLAVALVTALGVYVWSRSPGLSAVIGVSMVLSMVVAGLAGASIPIVLVSLGQDAAQSSSIFLTTVTDVVSFMSFLGIATLLASYL